jgi:hypothetical protein
MLETDLKSLEMIAIRQWGVGEIRNKFHVYVGFYLLADVQYIWPAKMHESGLPEVSLCWQRYQVLVSDHELLSVPTRSELENENFKLSFAVADFYLFFIPTTPVIL